MDSSSPVCPITPGIVLAGKFRVERIIGMGGMGVVVAATHLELDERVAIKFLLPQALSSTEAVNRFTREARAAVKIKSQYVARTLDVGRLEDGSPYIVMEYLEGADLAAQLNRNGPLSLAAATTFMLQSCEALADAHALGIIHRDLKPANLFVTRLSDGSECIKVLDFGISKLTNTGNAAGLVTNTAAMMGSPTYMAPEQMLSARDADAQSDIWSLGVTFYELLTGARPFSGETIPQLCEHVRTLPTPSVRALRPSLPAGVDNVIERCLEKARERRYANVAQLAQALTEFAPRHAWVSAERATRVLQAAANATNAANAAESVPATARTDGTITSIDPTVASIWGIVNPLRTRQRRNVTLVTLAVVVGIAAVPWRARLVEHQAATATASPSEAATLLGIPTGGPLVEVSATAPLVTPIGARAIASAAASTSAAPAMPRVPEQSLANKPARARTGRSTSPAATKTSAPAISSGALPDLGGVGREY
jgi:serine/threonine-protein kinase